MKLIKRGLLFLLLLSLCLILFRGWIYRSLVTYESVGERTGYSVTNEQLASVILEHPDPGSPGVREIIRTSLDITGKQLHFTAAKNDNDPNKLISWRSAHCVGYAHFFASSCNFLLEQHGFSDLWEAKVQVGQLYVFGTNVHRYFSSPFFKDHDFVSIENRETGEVYAVDPTMADYLGIGFVSYRE